MRRSWSKSHVFRRCEADAAGVVACRDAPNLGDFTKPLVASMALYVLEKEAGRIASVSDGEGRWRLHNGQKRDFWHAKPASAPRMRAVRSAPGAALRFKHALKTWATCSLPECRRRTLRCERRGRLPATSATRASSPDARGENRHFPGRFRQPPVEP